MTLLLVLSPVTKRMHVKHENTKVNFSREQFRFLIFLVKSILSNAHTLHMQIFCGRSEQLIDKEMQQKVHVVCTNMHC